jgi:hypothetical protein
MALQYVGGKTASIVGSTATVTNVSLTDLTGGLASSPAEGDFVLVAYATHSTADRSIGVTTSGYAEIAELYANDSRDVNLSVSWKIMGPTPDSAVDISATGATADPGAVAIHVWRGVDAATSLDVTSTTSTGLDSWVPNPPSITPVTSGAVVIAVGAGAGGSGTTVIGDLSSSELSNFQTVSISVLISPGQGHAVRERGFLAQETHQRSDKHYQGEKPPHTFIIGVDAKRVKSIRSLLSVYELKPRILLRAAHLCFGRREALRSAPSAQ